MTNRKIGILGAGNIGGNLGRRWAAGGHDIAFGVRDPGKIAGLVEACGGKAKATSPREAAAFGDVLVVAVPWAAVHGLLDEIGDVSGKILIDATNALTWQDGPMAALSTSAAEEIAARTGARVVKAFNTLGAEHLENPVVAGQVADVFLCSDDAEAKGVAGSLAEELGFSVVDLGPLRYARTAEQIAIAWIYLAMKGGLGRNIAFKVLRD